jgi:DNA repair exonuclease SbcCD nuclease subunit
MKILAIGDLHCKVSTIFRFDEAANKIEQSIIQTSPDLIVILGDIANDHEKIHATCMNRIRGFFDKLLCFQIPIYYIVGNHDMINNSVWLDPNANTIQPIAPADLNVVDSPIHRDIMGVKVGFCPYVYPGRFLEALDTLNTEPKSLDIIFAHQEFFGAQLGAIPSTIGDKWPEDYPLVVSGHIHDHSWLQRNILYVGAPMQHGYAEKPGKTISLIEVSEDKQISVKPISLGLAEKITIEIGAAEFMDFEFGELPVDTRLIISGSAADLHDIKTTKKFKGLPKTWKIIPKNTEVAVDLFLRSAARGKTYQELMGERLSAEPAEVRYMYERLNK